MLCYYIVVRVYYMALCNTPKTSHFWRVFDARKDFNHDGPIELTNEEQQIMDPVGYWFFDHRIVDMLLCELNEINAQRYDHRDLLKEMERIWRFNKQHQHRYNEPDWETSVEIRKRVRQLVLLTRKKLGLRQRLDNLVTGDITRHSEYLEPVMYPVNSTEKSPSSFPLRVPHIEGGQPPAYEPATRRVHSTTIPARVCGA